MKNLEELFQTQNEINKLAESQFRMFLEQIKSLSNRVEDLESKLDFSTVDEGERQH